MIEDHVRAPVRLEPLPRPVQDIPDPRVIHPVPVPRNRQRDAVDPVSRRLLALMRVQPLLRLEHRTGQMRHRRPATRRRQVRPARLDLVAVRRRLRHHLETIQQVPVPIRLTLRVLDLHLEHLRPVRRADQAVHRVRHPRQRRRHRQHPAMEQTRQPMRQRLHLAMQPGLRQPADQRLERLPHDLVAQGVIIRDRQIIRRLRQTERVDHLIYIQSHGDLLSEFATRTIA